MPASTLRLPRLLLLSLALAASQANATTREIVLPSTAAAAPPFQGITDYPAAVQAIVNVLAGPLRLPVPAYTMEVHSQPASFQQALMRHLRLQPETAATAMRFAKAAVGNRRVLVNDALMLRDDWHARLLTLAHEMTHTSQLELAGHRSLVRNQWLVEGFAEWVAYRVAEELGARPMAVERADVLKRLRVVRDAGRLAPLEQLDTLGQWVQARQQRGFDALYPYAYLAVDLLVERHSFDALLDYFRRHRDSADAPAHFEAAFGRPLAQFQQELDQHLEQLLR
ncbi:MAG TPA: hypothetical protein VEA40_00180 [Ramlibacter sp.]|nr:hypothetical protein [Ramlibacter sp.]